MADSGGIPELNYNHPEGRLRTRFEMDQWLRNEIPKVHWLRIIANRVFGLTKQISWDMKEIVLKHWLLDEMVRRQYIVGDQLGVSTTAFNDEAELRQFTQRLAYFIQAGFAVSPQHAEGVDMSGFQPPPAPTFGAPNGQPNGQQTAYPPGPPMPPGPPQGYAQPPMPPGPPAGPPQGYAQPPMPPGPPGAPMMPPGPPQQQYAPPQPPQQQYAPPPAAPPMAGPPMGPPPGVPQGPPAAAAPARRGRKPADQAAAPPQQQQGQPPPGPPGAPQGFAPAPFPGQQVNSAPQGFAPLPPQQNGVPGQQTSFSMPTPSAPAQQAGSSVDLTGVNQKLDQLLGLVSQQATKIAALEYSNKVLACVVTVLARGTYQRQGSQDPVVFLQELGLPLPPQ